MNIYLAVNIICMDGDRFRKKLKINNNNINNL